MNRRTRSVALGLAALLATVYGVVWYSHRPSKGHASALVPADTTLRHDWLYFYPTHRPTPPRGIIVLFGNDLAFWEPHQDLAWRFADDGYSVVGVDVRKFLATLPSGEPQRDSAFGAATPIVIARARHELHGDSLPLILGGHSFGAELAFYIAEHAPPPHLVGILALNTRATGHLFITARDWMNEEASGAYSFSVIDAVKHIDPRVRIALVRSEHDPFKRHDPELMAAGGARMRRVVIPLAVHSLKTMLVAAPLVSRAVRFLSDSTAR